MTDATRAILSSWTVEFWPLVLSLLVIAVYLRGWLGLRRNMPNRFGPWRPIAFTLGIGSCWLAIASPLDAFSGLLLQVHMTQHVLLMMVGPPLILLSAPGIPLLRGLPNTMRRHWIGPFIASPGVRRGFHVLTHPIVGWSLFVAATWLWHLPAAYELALVHRGWHETEHMVFLSTALLFWWPVIQPWPSRPVWPRWMLLPYLLAADLQNTLFSAIYVFKGTPIYDTYAATGPLFGITTLHDQAAAGAIMWVAGSAAFLLPVGIIIKQLLSPRLAIAGAGTLSGRGVSLPVLTELDHRRPRGPSNLLTAPLIGPLLRSRASRRAAQWILLLLAAGVVIDGWLGPDLSPMNLGGVLPWTHWRGLVVIALLVAGNAFCWSCPFMLPRGLAKRWFGANRRWPRALRGKWLAATLLLVYLWAYEVFSLWDSPWWTSWVIVGYFVAAFAVDAFFRGAAFCRWICPIGQFHFVESMISPREVAILDRDVCRTCRTRDCIRGGPGGRGCELDLYLPAKRGNLDCTFCMDCVRACPHDNVGVTTRPIHEDVTRPGWRGSIGRIGSRPDMAVLASLLTFGAFANALGMVGPVLDWEDAFTDAIGAQTHLQAATLVLLATCVVLPSLLIPCVGALAHAMAGASITRANLMCRLAVALVPIGFAMWLVHMLFHFLTAIGTIVPVTQRVFGDLGLPAGEPAWTLACCLVVPSWLLPLELLLLDAGLLVTIMALHRLSTTIASRRTTWTTGWLAIPALLLFALGVWIVMQPMQMRGTILP